MEYQQSEAKGTCVYLYNITNIIQYLVYRKPYTRLTYDIAKRKTVDKPYPDGLP